MRIRVSRSGGIMGLTRRGAVDTDAREDASTWHELVAAVEAPDTAAARQVPDAFVWTIEVDEQRTVVSDTHLTGPLRSLAERTLHEGEPPTTGPPV